MKHDILTPNILLGFDSPKELIEISFGVRNNFMLCIQIWIALIGAFVGFIISFVDLYVYNPHEQYFVLLGFLFMDFITGMAVGIMVRSEGFSTRKAQRIVFLLISYSFAMWGTYQMAKAASFLEFLPTTVFCYLGSVLLISALKNLSMLKLLPKGIHSFFDKYIDAHKDYVADILKEARKDARKEIEDEENITEIK